MLNFLGGGGGRGGGYAYSRSIPESRVYNKHAYLGYLLCQKYAYTIYK